MSYSGKDIDKAAKIISALKTRFAKVFDYKDGESIRPGEPWLEEIFNQLAASALGIPLLSESYFASGNCRHELSEMIARLDAGAMRMLPIKLFDEKLTLPHALGGTQYVRGWEHDSEGLLTRVLHLLDRKTP